MKCLNNCVQDLEYTLNEFRMMTTTFIYILVFFLSLIQSLAGVGVLVLGTPILLIMKINIIDIMNILLPISIITSFSCFVIIRFINNKLNLNYETLKYFLIICVPSIFIGMQILKYFSDSANFKYLVACIIFISLFIKIKFKKINIDDKFFKKIITFFIGIVHGITNSGGALLSIFFLNNKKKEIINNVLNVHWFYLLLALIQFTILHLSYVTQISLELNYIYLSFIIIISSFFGTLLLKKFHNLGTRLVYILAILSATTLIIF